ncbi:MAG: hypothetical protein ACTHZ9_06070 [Leucobacter sp.]
MRGLLLLCQFSVPQQFSPRLLDALRLPFLSLRGVHFAAPNNLILRLME